MGNFYKKISATEIYFFDDAYFFDSSVFIGLYLSFLKLYFSFWSVPSYKIQILIAVPFGPYLPFCKFVPHTQGLDSNCCLLWTIRQALFELLLFTPFQTIFSVSYLYMCFICSFNIASRVRLPSHVHRHVLNCHFLYPLDCTSYVECSSSFVI